MHLKKVKYNIVNSKKPKEKSSWCSFNSKQFLRVFSLINFLLLTLNIIATGTLTQAAHKRKTKKCDNCFGQFVTDNRDLAGISYQNNLNKRIIPFDELIILDVRISDLYRFDTSCEISASLAIGVTLFYKNKKKKCALSSMNPRLNVTIKQSVYKNTYLKEIYEPILNETSFNPFHFNRKVDTVLFKNIQDGGVYTPLFKLYKRLCNEQNIDNVVFLVAYSKLYHSRLRIFLLNMHNYLQTLEYQFRYRIMVVEQMGNQTYLNKGRLFNTAIKYIIENQRITNDTVDCVVLHDVDLIPANHSVYMGNAGDYRCRYMPWHMGQKIVNLSNNKEKIFDTFFIGGVLSLRLGHYSDVNGFSNEYSNSDAGFVRNNSKFRIFFKEAILEYFYEG
jgi:hypothetical protein